MLSPSMRPLPRLILFVIFARASYVRSLGLSHSRYNSRLSLSLSFSLPPTRDLNMRQVAINDALK